MNRIDRLDLLTRVIRDRPGVTTEDLAQELGVSVRSIFRDLAQLRDRGYPIEADRGRGGGVRLHASWGLGRVLLSTEEALGSLLTLAVCDKLNFPMFESELARARKKIVDAFPNFERRKIAPLRERIFVGPPASRAVRESWQEPERAVMRRLQVAFVQDRVVRVEYVKQGGEHSLRRVEPHAVSINWPAWYLLAYDHLRGEARTFRCDRFVSVQIEDAATFRPRPREIAMAVLSHQGSVLAQHM